MPGSLKEVICGLGEVPESDWHLFESILRAEQVAKEDFLLAEGRVCQGIHFIVKGGVRTYCLLDGKEVNTAFHFEQDFVCELESLASGLPSGKFIQALEATETMFIPKAPMIGLYQTSPAFQELGRRILERVAIAEQQYSSLFTLYSPEERYSHILQRYPHLLQRVPLQYLASYLGVARETLSRIRKRIA